MASNNPTATEPVAANHQLPTGSVVPPVVPSVTVGTASANSSSTVPSHSKGNSSSTAHLGRPPHLKPPLARRVGAVAGAGAAGTTGGKPATVGSESSKSSASSPGLTGSSRPSTTGTLTGTGGTTLLTTTSSAGGGSSRAPTLAQTFAPPPDVGMAASTILLQRYLIVSGGCRNDASTPLSGLWCYDTLRQRWMPVVYPATVHTHQRPVGAPHSQPHGLRGSSAVACLPVPLYGHHMFAVGQSVWILGGATTGALTKTLLSIAFSFTDDEPSPSPPGGNRSSSAERNISGGVEATGSTRFSSKYANVSTKAQQQATSATANPPSQTMAIVTGVQCCPLQCASLLGASCQLTLPGRHSPYVLCFGGLTNSPQHTNTLSYTNRAFALDLEEVRSINVVQLGEVPTPRAASAICAIGDDRVALFGGRDRKQVLDDLYVGAVSTEYRFATVSIHLQWVRVVRRSAAEVWPTPRAGHFLCSRSGYALLTGGAKLPMSYGHKKELPSAPSSASKKASGAQKKGADESSEPRPPPSVQETSTATATAQATTATSGKTAAGTTAGDLSSAANTRMYLLSASTENPESAAWSELSGGASRNYGQVYCLPSDWELAAQEGRVSVSGGTDKDKPKRTPTSDSAHGSGTSTIKESQGPSPSQSPPTEGQSSGKTTKDNADQQQAVVDEAASSDTGTSAATALTSPRGNDRQNSVVTNGSNTRGEHFLFVGGSSSSGGGGSSHHHHSHQQNKAVRHAYIDLAPRSLPAPPPELTTFSVAFPIDDPGAHHPQGAVHPHQQQSLLMDPVAAAGFATMQQQQQPQPPTIQYSAESTVFSLPKNQLTIESLRAHVFGLYRAQYPQRFPDTTVTASTATDNTNPSEEDDKEDLLLEYEATGGVHSHTVERRPLHMPFILEEAVRHSTSGGGTGSSPEGPTIRMFARMDTPPNNYLKMRLLGKGSYGEVYMALNQADGSLFALKIVKIESEQALEALKREIRMMRQLRHPNIVQYLGSKQVGHEMHIYMDFVAGGDTLERFCRSIELPIRQVQMYVRQLLHALEFLHRYRIVHRDIKGANVLLSVGGVVKLSDFGTAKHLNPNSLNKTHQAAGTMVFMAPEVMRVEECTPAADIWSLGCLVVELVSGAYPYEEMRFMDPLQVIHYVGISNNPPKIPARMPEAGVQFLKRCFQANPAQRPTASLLLQDPFVTVLEAEGSGCFGGPTATRETAATGGGGLMIPSGGSAACCGVPTGSVSTTALLGGSGTPQHSRSGSGPPAGVAEHANPPPTPLELSPCALSQPHAAVRQSPPPQATGPAPANTKPIIPSSGPTVSRPSKLLKKK